MAIASQQVVGAAGVLTGDTWTANSFTSDQYSEVQVTSTQLTGGQWVGPAVRVQNGGQNGYVGIYYWNNGSPVLSCSSGPGAAGRSSAVPTAPGRWRPGRS